MKIGILTFHYAHNCGACLQAFALKQYLLNQNQTVEILNYKNPKIRDLYPPKLKVKFLLYDFKHPKELGKKITLLRNYRFGHSEWKRQYRKFENFIDKYLLESNATELSESEIKQLDYDLFIAGSDQIWNKTLTGGYDKIYLLNFETKAKKAYYAASCGSNELPEEDLKAFGNVFIKNNRYSSVREPAFASFLSKTFNYNIPSVVDPCFLLSKSDYNKIFSLDKATQSKKYLFAYFISEKNKRIRDMVYVIANALGLDIIEFHYRKGRDLNKPYQTSDMGPEEFLKYIYNAEFVITNSFHGTVFSIMFEKQFYSVYDEDARKDNLLAKTNLSSRHIKDFTGVDLNQKIDFSKVNLDDYSLSSKDFLNKIIEEHRKND